MRVNTLSRNGFKVHDAPKFDTDIETSTAINYRIESTDKFNQYPSLKQFPLFTSDGKKGVFVRGQNNNNNKGIEIFDCVTDTLISEIPCIDAQSIELSPLGNYLITWSRPITTTNKTTTDHTNDGNTDHGNLKIWDTKTAKIVISFTQKISKKDILQWSKDEELLFHSVSNELHIFDGKNIDKGIMNKIYHKAYILYKVSNSSTPLNYIALFNPEASGKPARISIYSYQKVINSANVVNSNKNSSSNSDSNNLDIHNEISTLTVTDTETTSSSSSSLGEVKGPINSRTMFSATDATCYWNSTGEALLIHTHADVDSSNSSYYGATGLFLLTTGSSNSSNSMTTTVQISSESNYSSNKNNNNNDRNDLTPPPTATTTITSKFKKGSITSSSSSSSSDKELLSLMVSQSKEGPVYDVKWSPDGQKFVVCAGNMPCHTTVYTLRGDPLFECGAAHRNTISFSPHGRFLCIAGFGNLAGEMDFYDTTKMKKLGSNSAHCTVAHSWSPDSRYFMTAILAPRMNVDNSFRIFKYNGVGPVVTHHQSDNDALYSAQWSPMDSALFPNRGSSPKRVNPIDNDVNSSSSSGSSAGSSGNSAHMNNSSNTTNNTTTMASTTSTTQSSTTSKPSVYRPPGSTGALSDLLKRESSVIGKVGSTTSGTTGSIAGGGKPAGAYKAPPRRIPGMPPPGSSSNNANSSSSSSSGGGGGGNNNQKKKEKKESTITPPLPPATSTTTTATTSSIPPPTTATATVTATVPVIDEEKSIATKHLL